ncbi:thioesterase II family protein [Kitasatospora sp. NPDC127059]|uniref:thioesterase II family protein n=1 Tax=unclassified Kitasatospora TaxID=2633591 RepID=UPI0036555EA4
MGTVTAAAERERRWLKRFGRSRPAAGVQLLCFPHAGGNAGMFRHWAARLPWYVEPVAVQLPGRADRFRETPYDRMEPLIDDLVDVVEPLLGRPFACYGASMGARVAWALALALRERGLPAPRALFLGASGAPGGDDGSARWEGRSDGLEGYVREMGGTPDAVLAEPSLLAALLPTLRADLTVVSSHRYRSATPLDTPIHGFAGADDDEASPERMQGWSTETTGRFDLDVYPGGHFFDADAEQAVIEAIGRDLA